jgi:hypothetical protein
MPPFFKQHHHHPKGIHKPSKARVNHFVPPLAFDFVDFVMPPVSSVFDSQDCIWYYGTVYVKEATAVAKLNQRDPVNSDPVNSDPVNSDPVNSDPVNSDPVNSDPVNSDLIQDNQSNPSFDDNDDDADTESVSSIGKRNVGKQNQLTYLRDGMLLRHTIPLSNSNSTDEWFATFDAESNRIIRTPDGVAYDTLRQFARLHHNEVWGTITVLANVWSDPHFQHRDEDGNWAPLSNLKK